VFDWVGLTVTDVDGNTYNTVQIGYQLWMKENLKTAKYNNGDAIPNVTDATEWVSLTTGAYADYDNNPDNSIIYGKMYNWYTVNNSNGICMEGWHIPSQDEGRILIDYLVDNVGGKMKSTGTIEGGDGLWYSPNEGATNESGFSGLPAGRRFGSPVVGWAGTYIDLGNNGTLWTSSESSSELHTQGIGQHLNYNGNSLGLSVEDANEGYSIRCLKDSE
jgi:uncharacterized protein (TIGR02145 family)